MRALRGGIPRAFKSHRTPDGAEYGRYCRAKLARLGALPADALPTLREAGVVTVELIRLHRDGENPRLSRRDHRRIRREAGVLRSQLLALERRLEELASTHRKPTSGTELLAMHRRRGATP